MPADRPPEDGQTLPTHDSDGDGQYPDDFIE